MLRILVGDLLRVELVIMGKLKMVGLRLMRLSIRRRLASETSRTSLVFVLVRI